jgi:hypothetical protein
MERRSLRGFAYSAYSAVALADVVAAWPRCVIRSRVLERPHAKGAKDAKEKALVHSKQVLTQLRLRERRLGLLINFGEVHLKNGIERIVNGLPAETLPVSVTSCFPSSRP